MDIRQIVMVSAKRDPVVKNLCELFECEVAFNDPGVGHFGLENAVIPIGTDFLEVVSPKEENTTAGRFLDKRNGDGGYMIIIQVDDFNDSKGLVEKNNIGVVWETDLPEAKARVARARDGERLTNLLITNQIPLAVISTSFLASLYLLLASGPPANLAPSHPKWAWRNARSV